MRKRTRSFIYSLVACVCFVTGGAIEAQTQPTITSGQPPDGALGVPYSFTFTATGQGCSAGPSFDWSATGLPPGLSIDINSGDLTGTPTTPGSFANVMVTATQTNCGNPSVTQQYTITISQPLVSSLACNPTSLGPSGVSTCTVTLTQADPASATTVTLASNNALLTVPGTVGVAAGATTAMFNATAAASIPSNQSATVMATLSGSSQTATINLIAPELVSSVVCNPTSLGQNGVSNCTVTLTQPAPAGAVTTVSLSSNNTLLTVPPSVTVAAGATMAPFNATAAASIPSNQSATIMATFGNSFQTTTINLMAPVLVSGVVCNPTSLGQGAVSTCTVTVTQMAPMGGSIVTLASNNTLLTVPASVTVAAGATTAPFNATAAPSIPNNQSAVVMATLGSSSKTATINLVAPVVSGVVCNPTSLGQSAVSSCTVTLTQTDPAGGTTVTLASNNTLLTVPASVTVAAGATTATFNATAAPAIPNNQNAIVMATLGSSSQTATINLVAPVVSGVVCNPASLGQGAVSTCTVTLTETDPAGGTMVTLASNNTLLTVPASVTVAAGATTATFSATAAPSISGNQNAIVMATLGSSSQTATINLVAPVVSGVVCNPASLGQGAVSSCTVTLTETDPAGGTTVTLASNNTLLTVPASVTVAAGATMATFNATAAPSIPSNQNAIVMATLGSSSQTATINLAAPLVSGVVCNPATLGPSTASSTCTVTLTQTDPAAGTTVTLASNNTLLTVPASVTVAAGATTATFTATAAALIAGNQSAIVTATLGSSSQTATINLTPNLKITLTPDSISTTTGGSVSASFVASGGSGSYTYSISGQPAGVTLGSASLTGSPTQAGNFNTTVTVTDSKQNTASALIMINVLGLTTTTLPTGTTGQLYATSIMAAGGTGSYSFSATGLPPGLSLASYGYLSGTVSTTGTYPFGVTVSSGGLSVTTNLNLVIANPGALSISSASLPNGTVNVPYSQALSATGGLSPYTWSVSEGSLPQGLSLSASGIVSGTPGIPGSFSFGVEATDTSGAITTATASLTIQPATLTITTLSLPAGMNGVDYPQQLLAASGGVTPYTWALNSGSSLPSGLTFSSSGVLNGVPTATGTFSIGVTVTDQAKTQASATYALTIRPPSNDLILTSSSLTFSLASPAASLPASQVVGVQSTVASQPIAYTLSVNPAAPWLALANGTTTPDTITISLTSAALTLSPGPYQTTINATCTSSFCNGNTQTITVNVTVTASPAQLQISTGLVSFATPSASLGPLSQPINVQNAGGDSLGFASISCEASWCTAGPLPSGSSGGASLAGGVGAEIPVTVNPSLLTPGFYRTQVDIATSAGTGAVPVTLFISANATMILAPAGELFNQPAGSAPGNPNGSFLVSVNSSTPVSFTAAIVPVPGIPLPSWLVLGTAGGSASGTQPGTVSYSIDPVAAAALAPGGYYGEIQVTSPQLSNSPENFEVVLNVAAANTPVVPDAEPGGLLFITTVGGTLPPQTVTVYSGSASASTFQTSAATTTGNGWLSVTPSTGSTSATAPGVTTVGVDTSMLTSGVYRGGVSYSLSATAVRTVNVTLIVASGAGASAPAVSSNALPRTSGCTPSMLVATQTALVNSFSQPAGWPTPLQIVLSNDCGSTVNNGQVVATFSNGDPPLALPLVNPSQGLYSGTWAPAKPSSEVAINLTANAPGFPQATSQIAGTVVPNAVPVLAPNGTLHVFDSLIGGALAPGTIVAVYGQNLAAMTSQPTTIPLPNAFNGTSVIVGGTQAPIYYVSPGQINVQIPFELAAGNQYEVIVSANGALTTPQPIQLSAATPGLAAFSDGTVIAQHSDGSLVSRMAPAMAGEYLVVYLAGLGDTTVPVASGTASPSNPLAQPSATPTLTINGTPSPIFFAGLTPGLVGLYQMNFQVPAGLPAGDITIVVSQNGQPSNQTVLPYQP